MLSHFFSRNWLKYTAIKTMQNILAPGKRAWCTSYFKIDDIGPRFDFEVYQDDEVDPDRPPAIKPNGGLRGSIATRQKSRL